MSMESTKRPPKPQQPKLIKHVPAAKQPEVQELTNSDAQVEPYQGPDDRGLWWPTLPPRPSVDEVEQRKKSQEEAGKPELVKDVKYKLTYEVGNTQQTLPTNYDVYQQVVKAYPQRTPLKLTLGVNDNSVEKAEPISQ